MDDNKVIFERTLKAFLLKATGQFPILLLIGARQVGKTTLMQHVSEKIAPMSA